MELLLNEMTTTPTAVLDESLVVLAEPGWAERELCCEIIWQAVMDYRKQRHDLGREPLGGKVRIWFFGGSTRHITDFVPLCNALGLDPDEIRKAL